MTGEADAKALAECRERINALDLRLLELLNERTRIVEEIGRIKAGMQDAGVRAEARGGGAAQCSGAQCWTQCHKTPRGVYSSASSTKCARCSACA